MRATNLKIIILIAVLLAVILAVNVLKEPGSDLADNTHPGQYSDDSIQRGEYVATLSDCVACHSIPDRAPFSGGLKMATPVGNIYTTNITPDKETGIGNYSLADFDRAVRKGVDKNGSRLYPAMPYPSYAKLSDEDIRDLYSFFMGRVKAAKQTNKSSEIPWPLNMRWPLAFWNSLFMPTEPAQSGTGESAVLRRGAYIVEGPGHCGSCHTPRGLAFNEKGMDASSKQFLAGALLDGWYAPSLRNDANTGISRWSESDIYEFLKTGRNQHSVVFGSMAEAYNNSTQYLREEDLKAVAHYLKNLPPSVNNHSVHWVYSGISVENLNLQQRKDQPGAQTYSTRCSSCHGADGRGQAPWIPPLTGATSMMVDASSAINITLNGSARVVSNGVPDAYRMPPFRKQLSDKEVADVLTFIRSSWGNTGSKVEEKDIKIIRDRTDPASSNVILLQMR